jgi:hypothetical protein
MDRVGVANVIHKVMYQNMTVSVTLNIIMQLKSQLYKAVLDIYDDLNESRTSFKGQWCPRYGICEQHVHEALTRLYQHFAAIGCESPDKERIVAYLSWLTIIQDQLHQCRKDYRIKVLQPITKTNTIMQLKFLKKPSKCVWKLRSRLINFIRFQ